MFCLLWGKK
jgi:hypothetical protein